MPIVPYSVNLPIDVLLDHGTFFQGNVLIASCTALGVTRGAVKFDPMWTLENIGFDGKDAPIKGLDRKFYGPAKMSATMIEFGPAASGNQIPKLEVGIANADTGTTPNTLSTLTPAPGRVLYVAGNYLTYLRCVFPRGIVAGAGIKKYAGICFPCALVTKWDLAGQESKDVAIYNVEFEARKDMAAGTTADAPYLIELYETIP
jgi:hypothetical protein